MIGFRLASAALVASVAALSLASACTIHKYEQPPPAPTSTAPPPPVATTDAATPPATGYNPCAGKACGDACTICAPGDANCVETAVVKQCSAAGTCDATPAQCPAATDAGSTFNDCANKKCGDRCNLCAPFDRKCIESPLVKLCQPDGTCKEATTVQCK